MQAKLSRLVLFVALSALCGAAWPQSPAQPLSHSLPGGAERAGRGAWKIHAHRCQERGAGHHSRGGFLGRGSNVEAEDDQGAGTKAISLLQTGSTPDDGRRRVRGLDQHESLALLPVLTKQKIPSFGATSANPITIPKTYPYTFHTVISTPVFLQVRRRVSQGKELPQGRAAVHQRRAGTDLHHVQPRAMEKAGLSVTAESYTSTDLDLTRPMQRIKDANTRRAACSPRCRRPRPADPGGAQQVGLTSGLRRHHHQTPVNLVAADTAARRGWRP